MAFIIESAAYRSMLDHRGLNPSLQNKILSSSVLKPCETTNATQKREPKVV